jgi:hypothetical protein
MRATGQHQKQGYSYGCVFHLLLLSNVTGQARACPSTALGCSAV